MQNTINWYNGEIFEGKFILGFGFFLILTALLFYFLGNTPTAKALLIPMLVIGIFFSITGANMIRSNGKQKQEIAEVNEELSVLNEEILKQMNIVSSQNFELEKLIYPGLNK